MIRFMSYDISIPHSLADIWRASEFSSFSFWSDLDRQLFDSGSRVAILVIVPLASFL